MAQLTESAAMVGTKKRGHVECWLRKVGGHSMPPIFDVANRELVP